MKRRYRKKGNGTSNPSFFLSFLSPDSLLSLRSTNNHSISIILKYFVLPLDCPPFHPNSLSCAPRSPLPSAFHQLTLFRPRLAYFRSAMIA